MSTISAGNINESIKKQSKLLELVQAPDFQQKMQHLNISWETGQVSDESDIISIFIDHDLLDYKAGIPYLTRLGLLFCSRVCIDFETSVNDTTEIDSKYKIIRTISIGKNSATFLAEHKLLSNKFVLKLIRPGAAENIIESLKLISKESSVKNLVQPNDYFNFSLVDIFNRKLTVGCISFPYVEGISLRKYLNQPDLPLNSHFIASFIKQVGGVLSYLETLGAYHGDLHDENILVNSGEGGHLSFKVIDVSFGVTGSLNSSICHDNDLKLFRQHIWNMLSVQQSYLLKMSVRKYLGVENYFLVSSVMSPETKYFRDIVSLFDRNIEYENYKERKRRFLKEKFNPPGLFKLQRYEEITDPEVALKLFVPFPEIMENIKTFSNVVISGNRGSGKSTYLAALAYFPNVSESIVDYKDIFGIYFPCRQGEFRLFSPEMIDYFQNGHARVKHVLVIKIIRRTLESISEGIENNKICVPNDYIRIKSFLKRFQDDHEIMTIDTNVVSEIRNLVSIMIRVEMKEIDNLFVAKYIQSHKYHATELELLEFFKIIKSCFSELSSTKFHLLFDDAGDPNIPFESQKVINDFVISSNPIYCVKLSIEKYSYIFLTSKSKQLESGHDFYEYDIPCLLFTASKSFGLDSDKLEQYCYKIVEKRLKVFEYQATDIAKYVGNDNIKHDNLINSLSTGRRNAYYCGWSMIWKIADRTPRNLLEIISEIFSVANIDNKSVPQIISNRNQDRAIRAVSEKRLRSLSQISGTVNINGKDVSLGRLLFEIASSVGAIYRIYLKAERGKKRKDQYLAVERNDLNELIPEAEYILKKLITYGIFDESRLDFARDDMVKKPIYTLNKVFCPAFGIALRRDQHLRLSKGKFEQMVLDPISFVKDGTKKLRLFDNDQLLLDDLFEGSI